MDEIEKVNEWNEKVNKWNKLINEAKIFNIDISSCQYGDVKCLKKLITDKENSISKDEALAIIKKTIDSKKEQRSESLN